MKKLSLPKRILSFVLVGALLVGLFCGNMVASAAAEKTTKTVFFNTVANGQTGASTNTYDDNADLVANVGFVGCTGVGYMPYYAGAKMVWNYNNITEFFVYGLNQINRNNANVMLNDDTVNFKFYTSPNGTDWTVASFDSTTAVKLANTGSTNQYVKRKHTLTNIPAGTNYIKLESASTNAWNVGTFLGASVTYETELLPEISAVSKNVKNEYATPIKNGATVTSDALVKVTGLGTSGAVTVKKNGVTATAADFYNSELGGYLFTEYAAYEITAANNNLPTGVTLNFTLAKEEVGTPVYQNTTYNYFEQKQHGATTALGYTNLGLASSIAGDGKYSYMPSADGGYLEWNYSNLSGFAVETIGTSASYNFADAYIFTASADGIEWVTVPYNITDTNPQYSTWCKSCTLTLKNIPDGTNYIRLTNKNKAGVWDAGVIKVHTETVEVLAPLNITANYENYFGYYANAIKNGDTVTKDVLVKLAGYEPGVTLSIEKDGSPVTPDSLYSAADDGYIVSEKGAYKFTLSNQAESASLEFTIADSTNTGAYAVINVEDDIYNTGTTLAYERTNILNNTISCRMLVDTHVSDAKTLISVDGKYSMWAYNHGSNESKCYASWKDENGILRFSVVTLNPKNVTDANLRRFYGFEYSADGSNWKTVDFTIGNSVSVEGVSNTAVCKELHINNLPDDTKYVRFRSLTTDATKNVGASYGIIKAKYSYIKEVQVPEIDAAYKNLGGIYANMVEDGGVAKRATMLKIIEMAFGGTVKITKNGEDANLADYYDPSEDVYLFNEDGQYKVTAENVAGKSELSFTVKLNKNEPVYTEDIKVFDIFNENDSGAVENTYYYNPIQDALTGVGTATIHSYFPNAADDYMLWNGENIASFTLDVVTTYSDDEKFNDYYVLHTSEDGENWIKVGFAKEKLADYLYGHMTYRLTVKAIPDNTNYVRLTCGKNENTYNKGTVVGASYSNYREVFAPEVSAIYKNFYGVYANPLENGGKAIRTVKLTATDIMAEIGGKVTITKNGTVVNSADYYSATENAYIFNESGEYSVVAENKAAKAKPFNFTLSVKTEDTVVTKTVVDDIFNTGKTTAYERVDFSDPTSKRIMNITDLTKSHATFVNVQEGEKFIMWPYNHGKDEPAVYASWRIDCGLGSFTVETLNTVGTTDSDYRKFYSFQVSPDGITWTTVPFELGNYITQEGITSVVKSRELTVTQIPDSTKYVRFLSLITNATKNSGYNYGIIRAKYTTYIVAPTINANFKDALGNFINPLGNGAVAPSAVKLDVSDVGADVEESGFTVKKDGAAITVENGAVLTENGKYEVTAYNKKGTVNLTFTIKTSATPVKMDKYDFTAGQAAAKEAYDKLLSVAPAGAPEGFTKGDKHVIVNDTLVVNQNNSNGAYKKEIWESDWGVPNEGTNLTVGSDSKGYNKDGYFYFVNADEKGNKYSALSINYSVANSGSPADGYLSIYTADTYNGTYKLVKPTAVSVVRKANRVTVYNAVYYLGSEGSVVKVEYHPNAPLSSLWQGAFLAIQELTKLSFPDLSATADGKKLYYNDVAKSDVTVSVKGENYWFVKKDGKEIARPANNKLTEDGYYTVYAANASGTSSASFYIAKKIPVAQLVDVYGNNMSPGDVTNDDVRVISHNAQTVEILRDGMPYSTAKDVVLELNGSYTVIVKNEHGGFETNFIINRPVPVITAYNFRSKKVNDGDVVDTVVSYSILNTQKYEITLDGIKHIPTTEGTLEAEGNYVITATNAAGVVSLKFTIKFNPPLPAIKHPGNTVKVLNYMEGKRSTFTVDRYKYENVELDEGKALQNVSWTGFTGPVLRSTSVKEDNKTKVLDGTIIYKSVGFESFVLHVGFVPVKDMSAVDMYAIYASTDGREFKKLECISEHDKSCVTIAGGYQKHRIIAQNIPTGAKYIKVEFKNAKAKNSWDRCVTGFEYSYDSAKVGKLDVEDTLFMLGDADFGSQVSIDLYNNNTVIPKRIFEFFRDMDITLNVNLMNNKGETEYALSFNGMNIVEPMDFKVKVKEVKDSAGLKLVKSKDSKAKAFSFEQDGEWTMGVDFTIMMAKDAVGKKYALYKCVNGVLELVDRQLVPTNRKLAFQLFGNGDYVLSIVTDLVDENAEIVEEEEASEEQYYMVINRRRLGGMPLWAIILIFGGAAVVIAAGVVTLIILKRKGKLNFKFLKRR